MHNRFILTDIGPLEFGIGLDECIEGKNPEKINLIGLAIPTI